MATPRSTRARTRSQTPLPAIGARTSEAYGAKGKANLHSQVDSTTEDFATAFGTTRHVEDSDDANESQDGQDTIAVSESPKKRGRPPKAKAPVDLSVVEEEAGEAPVPDSSDAHRPGTALAFETTYFDRAPAIRPLSPVPRPSPERRPVAATLPRAHPEAHPEARPEVHVDYHDAAERRPNRFRVFTRALPRYIVRLLDSANSARAFKVKDFLLAALSLFFLTTIFAWVPLPTSMTGLEAWRDNFCWGLKHTFHIPPFDRPPEELEHMWFRFKNDWINSKNLPGHNLPDLQWAFNANFLERLERVEKRMAILQNDMKLQTETMDRLRETLPASTVLRVVDGRYEIPEDFWHALEERVVTNSDVAPLWTAYLERNEAQLAEMNQRQILDSVNQMMLEKQVVYREEFIQAIKENNDWLANEYQDHFRKMQKKSIDDIKQIAADAASDQIRQSPIDMYSVEQLRMLTRANQIHNTYEALHSVNWFSPGLGARVDPHLTSSTHHLHKKSWGQTFFPLFSPHNLKPNPPIAALTSWEEATDCWCGSTTNNGGTQLTVLTPAKIYPDRLVIEHIPAHGTLDIAAAPRTIELWAHLGSEGEAKRVETAIADHLQWIGGECGPKPSPEHACIARGSYDIHEHNYVQTIPVNVDAQALGLHINKFTVKVAENWGSPHTCLYRLRLTGDRAV